MIVQSTLRFHCFCSLAICKLRASLAGDFTPLSSRVAGAKTRDSHSSDIVSFSLPPSPPHQPTPLQLTSTLCIKSLDNSSEHCHWQSEQFEDYQNELWRLSAHVPHRDLSLSASNFSTLNFIFIFYSLQFYRWISMFMRLSINAVFTGSLRRTSVARGFSESC